MSNKEKPMSVAAQMTEPAEVKAENPNSLYSGRPNEWAKRQKQSGLEKKHEEWVMATLNFLRDMDIPFYSYHPNGDRDPRRDKEIPERLKLTLAKFFETDTQRRKLADKNHILRNELSRKNKEIKRLEEELATQREEATKVYKAQLTGEGKGKIDALRLLKTLTNLEEESDGTES